MGHGFFNFFINGLISARYNKAKLHDVEAIFSEIHGLRNINILFWLVFRPDFELMLLVRSQVYKPINTQPINEFTNERINKYRTTEKEKPLFFPGRGVSFLLRPAIYRRTTWNI
jgi:hypothetical protein